MLGGDIGTGKIYNINETDIDGDDLQSQSTVVSSAMAESIHTGSVDLKIQG